MKRIAPLVLVAAVLLIATGLVLKQRDPAKPYTTNRAAWLAYGEGENLLQAFRYPDAEKKLQEALTIDDGLVMARVALAELYGRLGRSDQSKREYALADSLTELVADPHGRLLLQVRLSNASTSRYYAARDSLLAAAQSVAPDELIVLVAQALRADSANELDVAEKTWQHILEINPNFAGAYNFLGYLYLNQGRYDEAEAAMRRYAFVAPDLANPHDSLGEVLYTVGRYEEAEDEFKIALDRQPDFFYSLINIGRIYFERGEVDRALSLLDQVGREVRGTMIQRNLEMEIVDRLFVYRLYADLEVYGARFVSERPDDKAVPGIRVRRLLGRGETATALALVDSLGIAYAADPPYKDDPAGEVRLQIGLLRLRGLAAEQADDFGDAARLFQEALTLARDLPPHYSLFDRVHLAYSLIPLRRYDDARIQVRETLQVNPRVSPAVLVAASVEAAAGQPTEAHRLLDTLERILERADADFPVLVDAKRLRDELPDRARI